MTQLQIFIHRSKEYLFAGPMKSQDGDTYYALYHDAPGKVRNLSDLEIPKPFTGTLISIFSEGFVPHDIRDIVKPEHSLKTFYIKDGKLTDTNDDIMIAEEDELIALMESIMQDVRGSLVQ